MSPIVLTPEERQALLDLRDHASKPYQRERAAALLKVADGLPAARVAREGLLRPRQPDTVYDWVKRFHAERLAGLTIRPGRGRKPAFFPSLPGAGTRQASDPPRDPPGSAPAGDRPHPVAAAGRAGGV